MTRSSIIFRLVFLGGILLICVSRSYAQQRLVMVGGGPRPQEATSRFVEWAGKEKARISLFAGPLKRLMRLLIR